jgi:protein involved in polysaccharide export with SLBB domain
MRQINWEYATIERLNKHDLRTQIIGFNLGQALDAAAQTDNNPELQPGDVVTVLSSSELQLPVERRARMVRVEGEVAAPGLYEVKPGETLPQLLQRIGGLTPQAYLYGAEFTRESVRQQQQQNLDQLIRKLETQLQSAGATQIANLTSSQSFQAATLQQQQQDMMRSQIARLKTLRSQGRVALDLDADTAYALITGASDAHSTQRAQLAALPPVPLEDGDRLVVPTVPAFVSAVGAVNSENAFIYRTGRTASDIIAAAGLTEDADSANAFVLRADGTVISRGKGWFSGFGSTRVLPGDTVVVPTMVDRESKYNFLVRGLKDWTQILSNFGVGAAALKSLGY